MTKTERAVVRAAMAIFTHPNFDPKTGWADMRLEKQLWKACAAHAKSKKGKRK